MTPKPRPRIAPSSGSAEAAESRRRPPGASLPWLRALDAAPQVVDRAAVARRLDAAGVREAADWRAAQLVALLVGVESDIGPGATAVRWDRGVPVRCGDLASRTGISESEVERALDGLLHIGVLALVGGDEPGAPTTGRAARRQHDSSFVRVATEYVTDGPAATVAWGTVIERLGGSAAGLLVARALADRIERPGRLSVVPYSALARDTRYSEGMVKRGVAMVVASGVVVQRTSRGRAPGYAFSDWALGRVHAPVDETRPEAHARGATRQQAASEPTRHSSMHGGIDDATAPLPTTLRASVAGVSVELPAATGGELVVETVVDGRQVVARLTIPPAGSGRPR